MADNIEKNSRNLDNPERKALADMGVSGKAEFNKGTEKLTFKQLPKDESA